MIPLQVVDGSRQPGGDACAGKVVAAMIVAECGGPDLTFEQAAATDLSGHDVF